MEKASSKCQKLSKLINQEPEFQNEQSLQKIEKYLKYLCKLTPKLNIYALNICAICSYSCGDPNDRVYTCSCNKMFHIKCFDKTKKMKIVFISCPCGRRQNYDRIRTLYPRCLICNASSEILFRTDYCKHYFCKICYSKEKIYFKEKIDKNLNLAKDLPCIESTCKHPIGKTDEKEILPEKLFSLKNNSKYQTIILPNLPRNEIEALKAFAQNQKNETLVVSPEEGWVAKAEVFIMANDDFFKNFKAKIDKKIGKHKEIQKNEENERQILEIQREIQKTIEEKEEIMRQIEVLKRKEEEYLKLAEEMKNLKIKIAYPKDWTPQNNDLELFEIAANTHAYNFVVNEFRASMGAHIQIISLKRIQNMVLFKKYQSELQIELEKRRKKNPNYNFYNSEKFCWHGTRTDPMLIAKEGFDLQYASDGGNFGRAIYFGLNARKSCGFGSFVNQRGNKSVLFAKVFVGETLQTGYSKYVKAPKKPQSEDHYDSLWNGEELVVYDMHRSYPYYLLEYR